MALYADVKLAAVFSDNAVLQQAARARLGLGRRRRNGDRRVSRPKSNGHGQRRKMVRPAAPRQGGRLDTLTVSGKNKIELKNVLVGEVWVCSGQSNMEWPLRLSFEPQTAIANSANPSLRLFTVPKLKADAPVADVVGRWQESNPESVTNFSAVAYFFGRETQKALGVPVGLIHTSWGGSPAEVWMSQEALEANAEYKKSILDGYAAALKNYEEALAKFEAEQAEPKKEGKTSDKKPPGKPFWKPSELYNGMIAPLLPCAIQGAIWYQGESNAGRAYQYPRAFRGHDQQLAAGLGTG